MNKITEILQMAIPCVPEVLDTLGGSSVSSMLDRFSGFTQLRIHSTAISMTTFCTQPALLMAPHDRNCRFFFCSSFESSDSLWLVIGISKYISTTRSARKASPSIMSRLWLCFSCYRLNFKLELQVLNSHAASSLQMASSFVYAYAFGHQTTAQLSWRS